MSPTAKTRNTLRLLHACTQVAFVLHGGRNKDKPFWPYFNPAINCSHCGKRAQFGSVAHERLTLRLPIYCDDCKSSPGVPFVAGCPHGWASPTICRTCRSERSHDSVEPMTDKVQWGDVLRAAAWLMDNPEEWPQFREKFGVATATAGVKLAERYGVPPQVLAGLKRDLGITD